MAGVTRRLRAGEVHGGGGRGEERVGFSPDGPTATWTDTLEPMSLAEMTGEDEEVRVASGEAAAAVASLLPETGDFALPDDDFAFLDDFKALQDAAAALGVVPTASGTTDGAADEQSAEFSEWGSGEVVRGRRSCRAALRELERQKARLELQRIQLLKQQRQQEDADGLAKRRRANSSDVHAIVSSLAGQLEALAKALGAEGAEHVNSIQKVVRRLERDGSAGGTAKRAKFSEVEVAALDLP